MGHGWANIKRSIGGLKVDPKFKIPVHAHMRCDYNTSMYVYVLPKVLYLDIIFAYCDMKF